MIASLQSELGEARRREMDLTLKAVEEHTRRHREILQLESERLRVVRDAEDRHAAEVSEQRKKIEMLRDYVWGRPFHAADHGAELGVASVHATTGEDVQGVLEERCPTQLVMIQWTYF